MKFILLPFYFFAFISFGQLTNLDSLVNRMTLEQNDSLKAKLLNEIAWENKSRNLKESEKYCLQAIEFCTKTNQIKQRSTAYNTLGLVYQESKENEKAIKYLELSVIDKEKIGDRKGLATVKNNIGVYYKNIGNKDLALKYFEEALKEHEALGNQIGQAQTLSNFGTIYRNEGNYEKSDECFIKSLNIYLKLNNKTGQAIVYNNLSANASDKNEFQKSMDYMYEAARIFEETKNYLSLITIYGNIAKKNKDLKNIDKAFEYCFKALEISQQVGDNQHVISIYSSLGDLYFETKSFTKAIETYSKGLKLTNNNKGDLNSSHLHLGLGVSYLELKKNDLALKEISTAVQIARKNELSKALARSLQKLSKYYVDTEFQKDKAKKYLDEAISISKKNNFPDILELCYKTYANYFDPENKSEESIEYLNKANKLNESIFKSELAAEFAEKQTKYETEKKEASIRFLEQKEQIKSLKIKKQDNELASQKMWLIILILGFLFSAFIVYLFVSRQKLKEKIHREAVIKKTEEEERTRIARDLHDELGSGLSKILFLTEVMNKTDDQHEKRDTNLTSISNTSKNLIDNMRDLIWTMNPDNTTLENLVARIREYCNDYLDDFPIDFSGHFPDEIPGTRISNIASRNIYMIVKESLQNIVKHADASNVELHVSIEDHLKINIHDDGKGFNSENEKSGNGLKNLMARSSAIHGNISIKSVSEKGTSVEFSVDIKNLSEK